MSFFAKFDTKIANAEIIEVKTVKGEKVLKAVMVDNICYPIMDSEELREFHSLLSAPSYFNPGHMCPMILQSDEKQLGGNLVSAAWFNVDDINSRNFIIGKVSKVSLEDGTLSVSMKMWAKEFSNDPTIWSHKTCMDVEYEVAHRIMTSIMLGEEDPASVAIKVRESLRKLLAD